MDVIAAKYGHTEERNPLDISRQLVDSAYFSPVLDPPTAADNLAIGAREALLLADGAIVGAAQEAMKDPIKTTGEIAGSIAAGSVMAAGLAAEPPFIACITLAAAGAMTGGWLYDLLNPYEEKNRIRNSALMRTMAETARFGNFSKLRDNMIELERALGPSALEVGLGLSSGCGAARLRPKIGYVQRGLHEVAYRISQMGTSIGSIVPVCDTGVTPELFDGQLRYSKHGQVNIKTGKPALLAHDAELAARAATVAEKHEQKAKTLRTAEVKTTVDGSFNRREQQTRTHYFAHSWPMILSIPYVNMQLDHRHAYK